MRDEIQKIYDIAFAKLDKATDDYFKGLWNYGLKDVDLSNWETVIESWVRLHGLPSYETALQTDEIETSSSISGVAGIREEWVLSFNNKAELFRLPVNPQNDADISVSHNNKTYETVEAGSFKAIGRRGLSRLTIESFFPARFMPYCVCSQDQLKKPDEYVKMIMKWKDSNRPIRVICTGVLNIAFAIEEFTWHRERGTGHISYTLELEEYPFANVPTADNPAPIVDETGLKERPVEATDGAAAVTESEAKYKDITVTVESQADTLWSMAQKYLGDASKWREIAKNNNIADPKKMYKGQKVTIYMVKV